MQYWISFCVQGGWRHTAFAGYSGQLTWTIPMFFCILDYYSIEINKVTPLHALCANFVSVCGLD